MPLIRSIQEATLIFSLLFIILSVGNRAGRAQVRIVIFGESAVLVMLALAGWLVYSAYRDAIDAVKVIRRFAIVGRIAAE